MTDEPSGPRSQGTSATYILGRLRNEGRFDLAEAVESGRLSAFAAGEAAGYMKRPEVLGTGSPNQRRKRQHQVRAIAGDGLSPGQKMELQYGPGAQGSLFNSREELESAWAACRDELLERANPGHRPAAWWNFEAPVLGLAWPGYFRSRSYLYERNVLSETERVALEREWAEEIARGYASNFTYIGGPGEVLHGAVARRKHFEWADIPRELVRRWSVAARRRARARGASSEKAQENAPNAPCSVEGEAEENVEA
jgi:hypothetical protein